MTANGLQLLSVPVKGGRRQRTPLSEWRIEYLHDWQRQHWGALYSAYGRAPFFEHYGPALEEIIAQQYDRVEDFNRAAILWLAREMRLDITFKGTTTTAENLKPSFEGATGAAALSLVAAHVPAYHQVFEDRWGFIPNLSAIDLLMNEGPHSQVLLR